MNMSGCWEASACRADEEDPPEALPFPPEAEACDLEPLGTTWMLTGLDWISVPFTLAVAAGRVKVPVDLACRM